jgi:hypothetical protein
MRARSFDARISARREGNRHHPFSASKARSLPHVDFADATRALPLCQNDDAGTPCHREASPFLGLLLPSASLQFDLDEILRHDDTG